METETENQAEIESNDGFIIEGEDQALNDDSQASSEAESAPVENKETQDSDGFQKRVNKLTADKYEEKRRADGLQKRLDEIEAEKAKQSLVKPKIDDPNIDYDEDALEKATRDYEIKKGVQDALQQKTEQAKIEQEKEQQAKVVDDFNSRAKALGREDFDQVARSIPMLPPGVADAIMQSEVGPEMVIHLGENLEFADKIASMTPAMAMMELGAISSTLSKPAQVKTSSAPDPITPLKTGSSMKKERGPSGATYE